MNVITIDLELNKPNRNIIQLGYTINNVKTGHMIFSRCININPFEQLDPFIIELTGITQEQVDSGVSLFEAYEQMKKDITKNQTSPFCIQWGLDHYELRQQLGIPWDEYCFARRGIDVKALYQAYAMSKPQGKTVAGLNKALEVMGLEFVGRQHNALNDAVNTFKAFKALTDKMVKWDEITKVVNRGQ